MQSPPPHLCYSNTVRTFSPANTNLKFYFRQPRFCVLRNFGEQNKKEVSHGVTDREIT
jgi:hypothetical protein